MSRDVHLVAAVADDRVAGVNGGMPWHLPSDLTRFRKLTTGHSVIMGARTWESIGHPLAGRQCLVLSPTAERLPAGAIYAQTLADALAAASEPDPVFVIGGHRPWKEAMPISSIIHLTRIFEAFRGDTKFPTFEESEWELTSCQAGKPDGSRLRHEFRTYRRRRSPETPR